MGVSGDFAKMRQMQQRIRNLAGVPEEVAKVIGPKFAVFTEKTFQTQTDPYGKAWKPLKLATIKRRKGGGQPLIRGGKMVRSVGFLPFGKKVKVDIGEPYARYHISTGRGILPLRGKLPDPWVETIEDEKNKVAKAIAEGRK